MQLNLFNAFRNSAEFNGILFYYNGSLTQNVIITMADSLKHRLEDESTHANPVKSRKLFSSFIEMAQNALHYSPASYSNKGEEKIGAIAVGISGDKFYIVCGNLIEKQYADRIREKIDPLLTMTIDEIKKAYREQLKNESHEADDEVSKGAGLGLLTIARDSSQPIEYSITDADCDADRDLAYFFLKATI